MSDVTTPAGWPPGGPARKSKLWIWVALAVVLILGVGIAVTAAALRPWQDDGSADPSRAGDGDDAKPAVLGDVDGDGHGDVSYYFHPDFANVKRVDALSNGNGFDLEQRAVEPQGEPDELSFDRNGDGRNDQLTWTFDGVRDELALSSESDAFEDQVFALPLSSLTEFGEIQLQVVHGDFDGDGDQDLAVAGPNDRAIGVSVLANDGLGTFADPVQWLSIPNAVIDATWIHPGDFDADGDTDLWAQLPAERVSDEQYNSAYYGDRGYALLTSSGKDFAAGAVSEPSESFEALLVGDLTGDGPAHVVGVMIDTIAEEVVVTAYDVSSGRLQEVGDFTGTSRIGRRSLQGATLSDVDGDGRADLVFVVKGLEEKGFPGIQVMKSTGTAFESALVWAETPACQDADCRIEFIGSRRY